MKSKHRSWGAPTRGFTLVEVMIVVAIIAILARIAYPAYTSSVLKGKRAQARAAILDLMQQEERYLTQNNTYLAFTNTSGTIAPTSAASTFKVYVGDNSTSPPYWLSANACGSQALTDCIQVVATPVQSDPQVGSIRMTSTGTKDCSVSTAGVLCWP